jgi:branched-chain amino acid transport system permease protein
MSTPVQHRGDRRGIALQVGVIALLFALQFVLPDYHHTNFARILVLASFAVGYNLLLGYTGLLSLGHAMFFAAGLYGAGLSVQYLGFSMPAAFAAGVLAGLVFSFLVGLVALRTTGVSFMIVTLMVAQACFLAILYFNAFTRGDEGFVLAAELRRGTFFGMAYDLSDPPVRYGLALLLFALCSTGCYWLVRSPVGRVLVAIRENEPRTIMLGYRTFLYKLFALGASGTMSAAAGAGYALLFSYVGATFASIQYSILPLLWVLLGGTGTILGPLLGALLMFYLIEFTSEHTSSYMLAVGAALLLLVLWFPKGILGSMRERGWRWLP